MKKLLVIAGEISGDQYAAALCGYLKEWPCHITAIGGEKLKHISDIFLLETVHKSVIGISVIFQKFFGLKALFQCLNTHLTSIAYDRVIIVDYQHHSEKIGLLCKKKGIPVTTFISPHFWMWKDIKSAQKLLSYTDQLITIFKKEFDFYRPLSEKVYYFGHPLTQLLPLKTEKPPELSSPFLAFFPGSRNQEFNLYLQAMLKSIPELKKEYPHFSFIVAVSSSRYHAFLKKKLQDYQLDQVVQLWDKNSIPLIQHADCMIGGSGTNNLEALWYKTPLVVLAALPPMTYIIAKYILRIKMPYVSLANIVVGKNIVEEIVQSQISYSAIIKAVKNNLEKKTEIHFEEIKPWLYLKENPLKEAATLIMQDGFQNENKAV